jgi:alkylation response protein AidB-like acyl-CoA dehydrogenase
MNDGSLAGHKSRTLDYARTIAPTLSAQSQRHDEIGKLSDEAIEALKSGNLFGLIVPRDLGGHEAGPREALLVYEEITRADAATGWVLTTCGFAGGIAGAYLDDDVVQSIFGAGMPVIAGSGAPTGRAVPADSGYRLSGQWSYGSGILHATHLHTGAVILEDGKPRKNRRGNVEVFIFAPSIKAAVIKQNWDVLGLRGTASVDYDIEDVYVPAGYAFPIDQRVPKRGGNIYRTGMGPLSALIHSGFALGMGRRALDELAILVQNNTGRLARLRDSESFLEGFGRAEAQYRAARSFVFATWDQIEGKITAGQDITTRDVSLCHLSLNHMMWTSAAVSDFAYNAAGGASLRDGALQRCFRDIHAATQHARVSSGYLREVGRELVGVVPNPVWERMQVVPKLY